MEKRLTDIYAGALYKSADNIESVENITEALKVFDRLLKEVPGFKSMLLSKSVSPQNKLKIMQSLKAEFPEDLINLFCLIIKKSRYFIFPDLLYVWTEKLKKTYNIRKTRIITPFEPDEKLKEKIDLYLKKVDPEGAHIKSYDADPGIIGGFKVVIGNVIYDNSFEGKLRRIKKKML
ncbi:MAG: ATP synthase F1 subunit delta [Spirochaetes bacterium]|nr:ATP synthase F1 subunit delta [Spirochaetota bacterium]